MADSVKHSTIEPFSTAHFAGKTRKFRAANFGWAAVIVVLTSLAYLPALRGGFIMDDDGLLTDSAIIKSSNGLARFWFTDDADDYWPMTNSSLWLEWRLWGGNPTGYRITNLLLHIAAALLIWAILQKLSIPGAYLAALLFAVHPVNVESIAWISQRKNALAMVFFLLSILWYVRAEERRGIGDASRATTAGGRFFYAISLLAFVLAMLSKGSVAVLPAILLLIVWWLRRRLVARDFVRAAPFFAVAIVLTVVNLWFQTHGSGVPIRVASFAQRLAGAGAVVWFYLSKAFVPIQLSFVYPPWPIETGQLLWWLPLLAALIITGLLWRTHNSPRIFWGRTLLFAWLFFGFSLVPVLGFTDVGFMQYSLVADHYEHIAIIAVAALTAAAWSIWHDRAPVSGRWMPWSAAAIVIGSLTLLTWRQTHFYGNPIALYEATLERYPSCWMAHNNLGLALVKAKRYSEATEHYRDAVRLKGDFPEALSNWAAALNRMNKPEEAIEHLNEALQMKPNFALAHNNLATAIELLDRFPEAIKEYQLAIQMKPDFAIAHYNLGFALNKTDRPQEAIDHYQQAIQLNPDFPQAEYNLGLALEKLGETPIAMEHFRRAARLNPDFPEAYNTLGAALSDSGNPLEAIEPLQQALRLNPDFLEAHNNLGIALMRADRAQEGIEQFQQALRLKPDFAETHLNLGVALGKVGRLQEAIEQFEETLRLSPKSIKAYTNMTKAYVLLKRPADAIAAAEKALELARILKDPAVEAEITNWLDTYRSQQSGQPAAPGARSDQPAPQH